MPVLTAAPWREVEIELEATKVHESPYTEVHVWADFAHGSAVTPAVPRFGMGSSWRLRFASPLDDGSWTWRSSSSVHDSGLHEQSGRVEVVAVP